MYQVAEELKLARTKVTNIPFRLALAWLRELAHVVVSSKVRADSIHTIKAASCLLWNYARAAERGISIIYSKVMKNLAFARMNATHASVPTRQPVCHFLLFIDANHKRIRKMLEIFVVEVYLHLHQKFSLLYAIQPEFWL